MKEELRYYTNPDVMSPMLPEDASGHLETLALELIQKSAKLSGSLHPITCSAIAEFLRPMNSYYTNLIEGHDTHPIDIDKVLKNDYAIDKAKRNLQIEAQAHIHVHKHIAEIYATNKQVTVPTSSKFIKETHQLFYNFLPSEFTTVKTKEGQKKKVKPGQYRDCEVIVGKHIAPKHETLEAFIEKFESFYNPLSKSNHSKTKRIISIAASHHRLAWIHPFLDGNGRVVRLCSDAFFMHESLDAFGLWSISRGLARSNDAYKGHLANADQHRYNDYDGRGTLSNKFLFAFCDYFLNTAIDQIDFMTNALSTETMLKRIEAFADLMASRGKIKPIAKHILTSLFLKGKISKAEAMRITNTSDKTLKLIIESLIKLELASAKKEGITMVYYVKYPLIASPVIFPGLYPMDKDIDILNLD